MINLLNTPTPSPIHIDSDICPSHTPIDQTILSVAQQAINQSTTIHLQTPPSNSLATPTNQYSETTIEELDFFSRERREAERQNLRANIVIGPAPMLPNLNRDVDQEFLFSNPISQFTSPSQSPTGFIPETPTEEYLSSTENKSPSF